MHSKQLFQSHFEATVHSQWLLQGSFELDVRTLYWEVKENFSIVSHKVHFKKRAFSLSAAMHTARLKAITPIQCQVLLLCLGSTRL